MATPLTVLCVKHIPLPQRGLEVLQTLTYSLLTIAKVAGPPPNVHQRHRQGTIPVRGKNVDRS